MDPVDVGRLEPREWLGRRLHVVIDRPLGSTHPGGGFDYPVNYGYVPGFVVGDGEELDVYILGPVEPLDEYVGDVIAVVLRRDDVEDKLVVGESRNWTAAAIAEAIAFQEQFFDSRVVTAAAT